MLLVLSGELLTGRCRRPTDDLMPSIHVRCLPPSHVDIKVLWLNVLTLSQVELGRPGGLRQSGGGRNVNEYKATGRESMYCAGGK